MMKEFLVFSLTRDGAREEVARIDPESQPHVEWYVVSYRGATLHPALAELILRSANERPDVDIFYGDEVVELPTPQYLCKPTFDATQLVAQDYVGLPLAVRRSAMMELGGPDPRAGSALFYDLMLRGHDQGFPIERITEVLAVNPADAPRASAADREASLRRRIGSEFDPYEVLPGRKEGRFQLSRVFEAYPEVTLIVPTRRTMYGAGTGKQARQPMVLDLLECIALTDWPMEKLRVLIGDDLAGQEAYGQAIWPFRFDVLHTPRPAGEAFNYAKKMNWLWRRAETEHLVLMNDDLVARDPRWLRALMTFACREGVGGVGGRLLYPDDTIQHVGMPAGVLGPCTHAFIGMRADAATYQDWADVHREWSIVTGALFATRRSVLEEANGFDERFTLNYNDADLCLRLRMLGYRIVYTPHAEFTHFESASRGPVPSPADESALFFEKWQSFLADDPAYHPRLIRTSPITVPVVDGSEWWSGLVKI